MCRPPQTFIISYARAGTGTRPPLPPRPSPGQSAKPTANGSVAGAGETQPLQQGRGASEGGGTVTVLPTAANGGGSGGLPQTMDISQLMSLLSGGGAAAAAAGAGAGSQSQAVTTTAAVGTIALSCVLLHDVSERQKRDS